MVTSEERMKILDMIQEGKLDVEDGARLLSALEENPPSRRRSAPRANPNQMFRVRVSDPAGKTKVSASLPMSLIDAGLNIASNFTVNVDGISMDEVRDAINSGMTGKIIDVYRDEDGEHVEVFID
jgi:hypothetical protein